MNVIIGRQTGREASREIARRSLSVRGATPSAQPPIDHHSIQINRHHNTIATAAKTSLVARRSCVRYAGIITEATLKIHKIPAYSNSVRVSFDSIDAAAKTVQDTLAVRDVCFYNVHTFFYMFGLTLLFFFLLRLIGCLICTSVLVVFM